MTDTPESWFERFRRRGDAGCFARVFDATSAELYACAVRLARDPASADDLVQDTYLTAIEHADRFDGTRRLVPWLLGILANHARHQRRDARREPPEPPRDTPPTPPELAEAAEAAGDLRRALAALPATYRGVLALRYLHGLGPNAIAEALDLSPGVVRVRLHRGLATLRRELPAGLASLAWLDTAGRGVHGVRAAVLASAAAARPAAALGTTLAGWMIAMKNQALVAAVLAALVITPWALWRGRPADAPAAPQSFADRTDVAVAAGGSRTDAPAVERTRVPTAGEDPATRPATLRVDARWRDGAAAAGIGLTIVTRQGIDAELATLERTTDLAGTCTVEDLVAGPIEVRPDRAAPAVVELAPGDTTEVRVVLDRGASCRGVVVDAAGAPVPLASIWLAADDWSGRGQVVAHADADGAFELHGLDAPREVAALARGRAPSRRVLVIPGDAAPIRLELGDDAARVAGRVLDAAGAPLRDAVVVASPPDRVPGPDGTPTAGAPELRRPTDGAGRFAFDDLPAGELVLRVRAAGHAPSIHRLVLAPGAHVDVDLRLTTGVRVHGAVVDDGGRPVGAAEVRARGAAEHDYSEATTGDDGRFELEVVGAGPLELRASARGYRDARLATNAVAGAVLTPRLVVERRPVRAGRLIDARGAPVAGWRVRWESDVWPGGDLCDAVTDEDGRFVVALLGGESYRVAVRREGAPWLPLAEQVAPTADTDEPLRLPFAADAVARLRGTLVSGDGAPLAVARVELASAARGAPAVRAADDGAADGRFTSPAVPPGDYELRLHTTAGALVVAGTFRLPPDETLDIGRVTTGALGHLVAALRDADGAPLFGLEVRLTGPRALELRDQGPELELWLPEGDYALLVAGATHVSSGWRPVRIDGGRTTRADARLDPGTRVNLVFPVPPPDGWDRVTRANVRFADLDGHVLLEHEYPVEPGRPMQFRPALAERTYVLTLTADDGRVFEGRFRGPRPGAGDVPVAIRVAAAR